MKLKSLISALLFISSFKSQKCKTALKLVMARIKLLRNKREGEVKQMRFDLSKILELGQFQTALIRVEHVIREENTMEAYDLLDIYCELLATRMEIIVSRKNCPLDLKEAISSVVFASPRCADIPELMDIHKHFRAKYGKEFITAAVEVRPECGVNRLVVEKLSAKAPVMDVKIKVLTGIAFDHNINWDPKSFEEQIQKPNDLLSGPVSFTDASKMTMDRYTLRPPAVQSQNNEQTSTMSLPTMGSVSRCAIEEVGYQEIRNASISRLGWNMKFKNVVSAALVAAESADKASIAARAAVLLANKETGSVQTSEGSGSGCPDKSIESLQPSPKTEAPAKMSRYPRNLDGKLISNSRGPYTSAEESPLEQFSSASSPVEEIQRSSGTKHMQSSLRRNDESEKAESSTVKQPARESSLKNASHVHPKLPDYETFSAYFHSLRENVHTK